MPIRIKPSYDLGPCILKLDGIKGIITRVTREFPDARFNATDETWEIYDEPFDDFLQNISQRKSLDSFVIEAQKTDPNLFKLRIVFNNKEASVLLVASPTYQEWFEHFIIDINKNLVKPDFSQLLAYASSSVFSLRSISAIILSAAISVTTKTDILFSASYSKIIIQSDQPNTLVENIKANLISNLIWVILVFLIGVFVTLITTGQLHLFGK